MNPSLSPWDVHPFARQQRARLLAWLQQHRPGEALNKALEELAAHSPEVELGAELQPFDAVAHADFLAELGLPEVAQVFGLETVETRLLTLTLAFGLDERLADWLAMLEPVIGNQRGFHLRLLAGLCELPVFRVERSLRARGPLREGNLLEYFRGAYPLPERLEASANLIEYVNQRERSIELLCRGSFSVCAAPRLQLADYPTLARDIARVESVLARREPGTHVLIHGAPGTGKTQLAYLLAARLGCQLLAVACMDEDGEPIEHHERLLAYGRAQSMLSQRPDSLLLFDEVEDVIRASGPVRDGRHRPVSFKGWLHEQLETSPTPSLWISNSLAGFDPAQLRRFACILEVPGLTRSHRLTRAERIGEQLGLERPWIEALAERDDLAPAEIEAAQRESRDADAPGEAFRDALASRLRASGRPALRPCKSPTYDLRFTHAEPQAGGLLQDLQRFPAARVLLSGPPGCGKTALAVAAARQLQRPLLQRRASDLLSPWLGETEQRLAECFAEAERESAVLLIDEVDSFLQARGQHSRRWELSQVNEFLKQLEDFEGCFFAATNLLELLDPAALRRFDYQLRFDWLPLAARQALLEHHLAGLGVREQLAAEEREAALTGLPLLLPGDFAALRRRAQAAGSSLSEHELLAWLRQLHAAKPEARRRPIGF